MTTIRIHSTDLNIDVKAKCDLRQASSPILIDWHGNGFEQTQFQCADVNHCRGDFARLVCDQIADSIEMNRNELFDEVEIDVE